LVRGYGQYFKDHPEKLLFVGQNAYVSSAALKDKFIADCLAVEESILGRIADTLHSCCCERER
jgi:hypothetical protein